MPSRVKNLIALSKLGLFSGTIIFMNSIIATFALAAAPDYIFFSIEGDTTGSTMTQGDEFGWGSNCDVGATINWEIWYDINNSSAIESATDFLLSSENITDGNLLTESDPVPDGWSISELFNLGGEPGNYIFRATDVTTSVTVQRIATIIAMPSPPNQFTGTITLPGITAPSAQLANRFVIAESDTGEEGVFLALTDNMGNYTMIIGADGTGVEFYLATTNVPGFVTPAESSATASGVVHNIDFSYITAVDSVWGFVKDGSGVVIPFETDLTAWSDASEKEVTTQNGRYVFYFSDTEGGQWGIETSSVNSPIFLSPDQYLFSQDIMGSFQHDLVLIRTDAVIYVRLTENGGLPVNNYRVDAYSSIVQGFAEAVSGTGADNVVPLAVSSLDNFAWEVSLNQYDEDLPIPTGLIAEDGGFVYDIIPGDTVTFNLINGSAVSGTITLDPGDDPIVWDDLFVFAGSWGVRIGPGGGYTLYTDTGFYSMIVYTDTDLDFATDPQFIPFTVTGSPIGGLDFIVNRTHSRVTGTVLNVPLPLDHASYPVTAQTGSNGSDGYWITTYIDQNTGSYDLQLPDGIWTIQPPHIDTLPPPAATVLTIGEIPDTLRTLDFDYAPETCCGQFTSGFTGNTNCGADGKRNLSDITQLIDRVYLTKTELCCEANGDVNADSKMNLSDITTLIDHIYLTKSETALCLQLSQTEQ